jgi:hypothetical protein
VRADVVRKRRSGPGEGNAPAVEKTGHMQVVVP